MYVPFMYVNDGVCDYELCCDGSEEYKGVGGVKCENKCSQIGKEYRKLQDEKRRKTESAEKKRKSMIDEAAELRRKAETKVVELRAEIAQLETKKADLEKKKVEVERQERGKVVQGEGAGGPLGVLVGLTKTRISELRQTLESVINQRNDLRTKVEELETILRNFKAEYNPNFNDEGVKAAVKSFEDYASREVSSGIEDVPDEEVQTILKEDDENNGVNWKEFETDNKDDTDIRKTRVTSTGSFTMLTPKLVYSLEAYLPGFLRTVIHDQLESIRVWLIQNGILADSGPGKESHLIKAARDAVSAVEKDLKGKKTDLDKANEELSADYGSNDIFRSLKGKCVSTDSGEYTYELCWLDKTSQKSKKGHGNTSMGHFKRIDREMADEEEKMNGKSLGSGMRMVLKYEDGQQCWNGPRRRTDVWLGCAETEELWRISESEKCVYRMEVGTPAACEKEDVVQRAKGKDEL